MSCFLCRPCWLMVALLASSVAAYSGCSSSDERTADAGASAEEEAAETPADDDAAEDKPFVLADLVEPFAPPTLEELDKTADWQDRPVRDGMDILREQQGSEQPPPIPIDEARALRNNSNDENEKILNSLGRVAAPDGSNVDYASTWVRHVSGDLKSTNPIMMTSITEFEFHQMCAFALLSTDRGTEYFAPSALIKSWQSSKDHLKDKFVLRDDIFWSDGKPITAHDIAFSFKAIMSSAVPVLAIRQSVEKFRWVEAYDDQTVVIFQKEAYSINDGNISSLAVIPKHIYEESIAEDPTMARSDFHTNLEDHPVVGGPFELTKRNRNQEFVVSRRENYYLVNGKQVRPKPHFKEIRTKVIEDLNTALLALKAGQIEEMMLRPEHWVAQANGDDFYRLNTKVYAVEWTEFHFLWNQKTPYFSDVRVRQAMSWAFDYKELLETICHGLYQPCRGPFHPTNWAFPKDAPEPYHQDLDKAEELLDAAGWTDSDGDGIRDKEINGRLVPFEFTLNTYQTETALQAATLLKENLQQIGIICNVKPTEFTVLVESMQNRTFDASMGGWGAGNDPDSSENIYATNAMRNYGSYSNPRVDELFKKGRLEFDREKRAAIYGEIHNLIWQDQPYTYLFNRNAFYAFNKKLRGYNFSPRGPYLYDPGMFSLFKTVAP